MLTIMEKYGWDWWTYQAQPLWVTNLAKQKMVIEAKLEAHAAQNLKETNG